MFSEAQYTDTAILIYSYFVDQEPAREEEKSSSYPSRVYEENSVNYCATTTQNGLYWYTYCLNNPLIFSDPDGEFWHIIIGGIIGGTINWLANGAELSWSGLGYFAIGAASGTLSAAIGVGVGGLEGTALAGTLYHNMYGDPPNNTQAIVTYDADPKIFYLNYSGVNYGTTIGYGRFNPSSQYVFIRNNGIVQKELGSRSIAPMIRITVEHKSHLNQDE